MSKTILFVYKAEYFPFNAQQNIYEYHYFGCSDKWSLDKWLPTVQVEEFHTCLIWIIFLCTQAGCSSEEWRAVLYILFNVQYYSAIIACSSHCTVWSVLLLATTIHSVPQNATHYWIAETSLHTPWRCSDKDYLLQLDIVKIMADQSRALGYMCRALSNNVPAREPGNEAN